jgi:hypothetical protein
VGHLGNLRLILFLGRTLGLVGLIGIPALAQNTNGTPCTVRIRPRAAADYDPSTEVNLRGQVAGWKAGAILLQITAGILPVDTGAWNTAKTLEAGSTVEILASKRVEEGRQRFLAREIRYAGGVLAIRDARGVPNPAAADQL